jgi:hypothetical protein
MLQVESVYKENADIGITWHTEEQDFTTYPKEIYYGTFEGIDRKWLATRCADIYKRWAEEVDQVVFLVHSDNWNLNGVWGWNMSYGYSGYGVQQVRFADVENHTTARNVRNSAGTLYHELHHDHDAFIFNYTGKRVEEVVKVKNWDDEVTHGESTAWAYIRTVNDNTASIKAIAPLLREALAKRRAIFDTKVGRLRRIVQLLEQVVVLQRQLISRQRGDLALLPDGSCALPSRIIT